jgi:hypothetical protein
MAEEPLFAAALFRDGARAFVAVCQVTAVKASPGDTQPTWLGMRGLVRGKWMVQDTPGVFCFSNNSAEDDKWLAATYFIRTVPLRKKGDTFVMTAAIVTELQMCEAAFNAGRYRFAEWEWRELAGTGGELLGPRPALSLMLRDAIHRAMWDDNIEVASLRFEGVLLADFFALMRGFKKKHTANDRLVAFDVHTLGSLNKVLGGKGWDSQLRRGASGYNRVVVRQPAGRPRPFKIWFLEHERKFFAVGGGVTKTERRGHGHVGMSFVFEWDRDELRLVPARLHVAAAAAPAPAPP